MHSSCSLWAVPLFLFGANVFGQTVSPGGVVNAAGFQAPVAPGSVIAIFGSNLAPSARGASTVPLPTNLGGVSVSVNGTLAPLFYVSPSQVNAQLPFETAIGQATLSVNGSAPVSVTVAASAPGIAVYGSNRAVAVNADLQVNGPDHPAVTGSWVTIYMSGQGAVDPRVPSGAASPSNPLARPVLPVTATIGGQLAEVIFAGLTPGAVGLLQVNVRIPAMAPGDYPLIVTIGQAQSNAPMLAVSSDGSPVLSTVRTIAYHQVTSLPDNGPDYRTSTAINGNGTLIAYTYDPDPNQIWVMNFDGTGNHMVDSYKPQCYCGSTVDISDNGDRIVSTEGRQIRLVDRGAVEPLLTIDSSTAGISGLKIEGDGHRVFFMVDRDSSIIGGPNPVPIQRGLYVIDLDDGGGMRQVVSPDGVAALFGEAASSYRVPQFTGTGNAPNHTLSVTANGRQIVFSANKGGYGPDALFGVNLDGSGLHIILGPIPALNHLAISAGASKVLYVTTSSDYVVETGVVNFDGSGRLALRHDALGSSPGVQLTADGSLALALDILYRTDGRGALQLSTVQNVLTPGRPVMNSTARRYVYSFVYPGTYSQGLSQLATAEIDPKNLGEAPSILGPAVNPGHAVAGGIPQSTVTATVSSSSRILGVNYAFLLDGLVEELANADNVLVDDGTWGDRTAGDGVYTNNNVIARTSAPVGPRLLRLFAETRDGSGKLHGALIDVSPFSVVAP